MASACALFGDVVRGASSRRRMAARSNRGASSPILPNSRASARNVGVRYAGASLHARIRSDTCAIVPARRSIPRVTGRPASPGFAQVDEGRPEFLNRLGVVIVRRVPVSRIAPSLCRAIVSPFPVARSKSGVKVRSGDEEAAIDGQMLTSDIGGGRAGQKQDGTCLLDRLR